MSYNPNDLLKIFFNKNFYIATCSILIGILGGNVLKIVNFKNHEIISFLVSSLCCFFASFLILTIGYEIFKKISKDRYVKYCPECDSAIGSKNKEEFCRCRTKYLIKCPKCNTKIRDNGQCKLRYYLNRICPACGEKFEIKPKTGNEWMAREIKLPHNSGVRADAKYPVRNENVIKKDKAAS